MSEPEVFEKSGGVIGRVRVSGVARMSTALWAHWAMIAIDQEKLAWAARQRNLDDRSRGETPKYEEELHSSMITVDSATSALDCFYGSVKAAKGLPRSPDARNRAAKVRELLKLEFSLGKQGHAWEPDFKWLWDLRGEEKHHYEESRSSPHPAYPMNTAYEFTLYTPEAATKAVDVMMDVLGTCITSPRPPLKVWADGQKGMMDALHARRGL